MIGVCLITKLFVNVSLNTHTQGPRTVVSQRLGWARGPCALGGGCHDVGHLGHWTQTCLLQSRDATTSSHGSPYFTASGSRGALEPTPLAQ